MTTHTDVNGRIDFADEDVRTLCRGMAEAHERRTVLAQTEHLRDDRDLFYAAWQYARAVQSERGYELGSRNKKQDVRLWSHHFRALVITCADVLREANDAGVDA